MRAPVLRRSRSVRPARARGSVRWPSRWVLTAQSIGMPRHAATMSGSRANGWGSFGNVGRRGRPAGPSIGGRATRASTLLVTTSPWPEPVSGDATLPAPTRISSRSEASRSASGSSCTSLDSTGSTGTTGSRSAAHRGQWSAAAGTKHWQVGHGRTGKLPDRPSPERSSPLSIGGSRGPLSPPGRRACTRPVALAPQTRLRAAPVRRSPSGWCRRRS